MHEQTPQTSMLTLDMLLHFKTMKPVLGCVPLSHIQCYLICQRVQFSPVWSVIAFNPVKKIIIFIEEDKNIFLFVTYTNYTEYNQQWNLCSAFNPSKCTHTWSSGQSTLRHLGSFRTRAVGGNCSVAHTIRRCIWVMKNSDMIPVKLQFLKSG